MRIPVPTAAAAAATHRARQLVLATAARRSLVRRRPFHHLLTRPRFPHHRRLPPLLTAANRMNPWPGVVTMAQRLYSDASNAVEARTREFEDAIERAKQHIGLDDFTDNVLPALKVIAESLEMMGRSPAFQNWTSAEWLLGLTVLAQHNTTMKMKAIDQAPRVAAATHAQEHKELVKDLLRYVRICDAVYADTVDQFCEEAKLPKETVVKAFDGSILSPKYLLLLDDAAQEIVLVIRGTASILDFMTDICLVNEPFADGQGHRGMVLAAQWLVKEVRPDLVRLTHKHRGYKLVITGHSLGAGVSALVAMQLKPSFPNVRCVAFAAPASVTQNLAQSCQDYVITVVNGDDCVPRLHQHSMMRLQEELSTFDWRSALKQMVDEEVANHKSFITKKRDEHLQMAYDAFQSLKQSQTQQAEQQLAKVLEQPLVSASLKLTKAAFDTDAPPLQRLASVKQVVQQEKYAFGDDAMLWDTLEATVGGLERLARAIHNPTERQALLVKSKSLLASASASDLLAAEAADQEIAPSPASDKWSRFRTRIKSVVDDTTQSIMQDVDHTLDDVAESVAVNVEQIRLDVERTMDDVSLSISANVEQLKQDVERTLDDVSESVAANVEQLRQDAKTEIEESVNAFHDQMQRSTAAIAIQTEDSAFGLAMMATQIAECDIPEHADGRIDYGDSDEIGQEEKAAIDEANDPPQSPLELLHEPLFPPGRIVYLNRRMVSVAVDDDDIDLSEVAHDGFSRVVLSNQMILDHLCTTYERVLQITFQTMNRVGETGENNRKEGENCAN